jgi:hypothetical protein
VINYSCFPFFGENAGETGPNDDFDVGLGVFFVCLGIVHCFLVSGTFDVE